MNTPVEPELKVRLLITSDSTNPSTVSAALGLEPTQKWLKGERVHPKATNKYDHNGWVLVEADYGEKASVEALVNKVFRAIDLNRVKQLTLRDPTVEVELSIIVYLSGSAPSVFLSSHQVKCLAEIGAEIDIDIYP
jgi:hypothetical protein